MASPRLPQHIEHSKDTLERAIHMLHEQAHDDGPIRYCQQDPCRDLKLQLPGPAPRVVWSR